MSRVKFFKKSYRNVLILVVITVALITLLIALSVNSLAKYISSKESDGTAGVASVGIEVVNLVDDDNLGKATVAGSSKSVEYDYQKVIPGVDILVPDVQVKFNAEVNYELYIKVTVPDADCIGFGGKGKADATITYEMSSDWEEVEGQEPVKSGNGTVYTYKYIGDESEDGIFESGAEYNLTLGLLDKGKVFVSQNFKYDSVEKFTLTFEAIVRQAA